MKLYWLEWNWVYCKVMPPPKRGAPLTIELVCPKAFQQIL